MVKFKTAYNTENFVTGENYSKIPSVTQPEQVLPLQRIIDGLKNGTILLDPSHPVYDIPEHTIDVSLGTTPEQTNANIAAATVADLAESANQAGENITAHPGFQIEDAQPTVDAIEAALSNVEFDGEQAAANQTSQAADKPKNEAFGNNAAENGTAATAAATNVAA